MKGNKISLPNSNVGIVTLSDKIEYIDQGGNEFDEPNRMILDFEDVREFINQIKKQLCMADYDQCPCNSCVMCKIINEEAGDKLDKKEKKNE